MVLQDNSPSSIFDRLNLVIFHSLPSTIAIINNSVAFAHLESQIQKLLLVVLSNKRALSFLKRKRNLYSGVQIRNDNLFHVIFVKLLFLSSIVIPVTLGGTSDEKKNSYCQPYK